MEQFKGLDLRFNLCRIYYLRTHSASAGHRLGVVIPRVVLSYCEWERFHNVPDGHPKRICCRRRPPKLRAAVEYFVMACQFA